MPIYEYNCEACKAHVEVLQKSTDAPPATCSVCGKGPMVKQLSMTSFALKGTGWYVTDFKGGSSSGASSTSPSGTSSGSGAKSSETASAPSSDSSAKSTAPEKS